MCGGEKTGAPFPNVNAPVEHVIKEQIEISRKLKPEHRAKISNPNWNLACLEKLIKCPGKLRGALVQPLLKPGSLCLDLFQHGLRRGHSKRMLTEGPSERRSFSRGEGVIAKVPHASIDAVHKALRAGHQPQRQTAANDLPV